MQIKCSCNGGNPNCYKCNGWGYIEQKSPEAKQQNVFLSRRDQLYYSPKEKRDTNITLNNLPRLKKKKKHQVNNIIGTINCPFCSRKFTDVRGLISHVRSKHINVFASFIASDTVTSFHQIYYPEMEICDICGMFVKNLRKHKFRSHSIGSSPK